MAALALAALAIVPYLLANDPAQFAHNRSEWLAVLGASPVVAFILVVLASPASRRRRRPARRRASAKQSWAALRRSLLRTAILLLATNITAFVLLLAGNTAHGPHAAAQTLIVVGSTAAAALVVLVAIRLWDRWFPPGEHLDPVTVESVRAAAVRADQTLRRVRAQNQQLSRLAATIEQQLQAARLETNFVSLRDLHHESVSCADGAYGHYRSAGDSLYAMFGMLVRVRANLALRMRPAHNPATGRRERPDRQALNAAAANLTQTRQLLDVEVKRGLAMVRTLNANTSRLKHSIKDNCGERGRQWYEALEKRIEARRREERGAAA